MVKPKPKRKHKSRPTPAKRQTKKSPVGRKPVHNWDLVYQEFVEGVKTGPDDKDIRFYNLRELSERHDIPYNTIRERSGNERWSEKKSAYQSQVMQERQKAKSKLQTENAAAFDEQAYNAGRLGLGLVMRRLGEIAKDAEAKEPVRQAALAALKRGEVIDDKDLRSSIYYRELEALASAADRWQQIGMRALGTDVQKHEISGMDTTINVGNTVNVQAEITRDDPERSAAIISSMIDAGLIPAELVDVLFGEDQDEEDVVDAEVLEITDGTEAQTGGEVE